MLRGTAGIGAALLGALALCACSGSSGNPASSAQAAARSPLGVPFATSLQTTQGTWASVAMGHLDEPLNTFWQLFFLPAGGKHWRNEVSSLGVATNGGLLLATADGRSLLVATRPSNLLHYSALLLGAGSRPRWTPGTPLPGAADALSPAPSGNVLAILGSGGESVLEASSLQGSWRELINTRALAGVPAARVCAPTELTAVGHWSSASPLVGSACGRPGVVGMFAAAKGSWKAVGPALPASLHSDRVQVLWLGPDPAGIAALLSLDGPTGASLLAAWSRAGATARWTLSPPLALDKGATVLSVGQAQGGGEFVLYSLGSAERGQVIDGPGGSWKALPAPPTGTATLAFPEPGRLDALAVDETVMADWTLRGASEHWSKQQSARVKILFGSSE